MTEKKQIKLPSGWLENLAEEFEKSYMHEIKNFLNKEYSLGKIIYPDKSNIFSAFNYCDFNDIKVVILGQDPYHGPSQAHGLSFSVKEKVPLPPSLVNIYKELETDLDMKVDFSNGNLEHWASQGVFLLNTTLTVEKNKPLSHSKIGWNIFTDKVIQKINELRENIVFILWGSHAHSKSQYINNDKHLILKSVHPSPLSAYRGFFGSKPFSKTNEYLHSQNKEKIIWVK